MVNSKPLDLSDSDSEGASPNPRPAAPREIKSAQPKSVKTAVQSGRVRASVTADDEDDSDASQDSDNAMKTVLEKLVKQVSTLPPNRPPRGCSLSRSPAHPPAA